MSDAPTRIETEAGPTGRSAEQGHRTAGPSRLDDAPGASAPEAPGAGGPQPRPRRGARNRALPIAGAILLLVLIAAFAYWRANVGLVKTDNAQTAGDVAPVSAQVPGTVVKIDITDNQYVRKGTTLVELDPTDYRVALDQAKANLATAKAQVSAAQAALTSQEQQYTTGLAVARGALAATTPQVPQAQAQLRMDEQTTASQVAQAKEAVTTAKANVTSAKTAFDTAGKTLSRDRQLLAQGAVAQQQVDTDNAAYQGAEAQYQAAQDQLRQAQAALASAEANRQQVTVAENNVAVHQGDVAQARATLQQAAAGDALVRQRAQQLAAAEAQAAAAASAVTAAQVNLNRTLIQAPADGWVTNRTVEIGQVVQANQPLLSVTLANDIWVVANVKETQLGGIRVGDPVRITVDAFRGKVFDGRVQSIGAATGSTVALLPPDNATGNFVKVVQLVPVKIALDPGTDPGRQLQVGLSAEVTIDTRHRDR